MRELCPGEVMHCCGGGPVSPPICGVALSRSYLLDPHSPHLSDGRHNGASAPGCCANVLGAEARRRGRLGEEAAPRGLRVTVPPAPADTCEADCMRKRAEQSLQAAIKTLRKSIGRQHFSVQVAGTEYAMAQWPAKALEGQGACVTGQVLQDGKCGASLPVATGMPTRQTFSALPSTGGLGQQTLGGDSETEACQREAVPCSSLWLSFEEHSPGARLWAKHLLGKHLHARPSPQS